MKLNTKDKQKQQSFYNCYHDNKQKIFLTPLVEIICDKKLESNLGKKLFRQLNVIKVEFIL